MRMIREDGVRLEEEEEEASKNGAAFLGKGLMDARTILISDPVDHKLTAKVMSQLLFLDHQDAEAPIKIFINSPGGSVYDGFAIYDMIRLVRPKVVIISAGLSASAATVIMLAAEKEDRLALPNARIMIHQPSMQFQGAAEDVRRTADEVLKIKAKLNKMYADETGQSIEKVREDTDRDYWLSPDEAVEYGLISRVVHGFDDIDS
jgi:ATP-dependent Clp protease protease subunit